MPHTLQRPIVHTIGRLPSDNTRKKVSYIVTAKVKYRAVNNWFTKNLDFVLAVVTAVLAVFTYGFQSVTNELLEQPLTETDYTASTITQVAANVCFVGAIAVLAVLISRTVTILREWHSED